MARHLLKLREAENNFLGFVKMLYPNWELPDFHLKMIDALDRLEKNKLTSHFGLDGTAQKDRESTSTQRAHHYATASRQINLRLCNISYILHGEET